MTAMEICYSVLILAGAFTLVSLGILLLRTSTALKQVGNTIEIAQETVVKVNKILDDVDYKLRLLNAPIESVANFFDPNKPKFNPLKIVMEFLKKK